EALPSGHVKVSWRGKRPWNVANLASQFGGGGHAYAAAAQVTGTLPEVLQSVLQRLEIEAHG
ncbi:MAG: DHHA1 domain-containing protein, partial [Firmicutes bacterium]|nr:DHHA1 domain-containing protein [Bacillota bacterium]